MTENLWQSAEEKAEGFVNNIVVESKDSTDQPIFIAKFPELYGCMAQGVSKDEALENLHDACVDYIYCLLIDEQEIPKPTQVQVIESKSFSGNDLSVFNIVTHYTINEKKSNKKEIYAVSLIN